MVVWKQIKPKKLREDALRLELLNQMRKTGRQIKDDFEKTVATFSAANRPVFEMAISLTGPGPVVVVEAGGSAKAVENYGRLDEGTEPHIIRPVRAKVLAFPANSEPKTRPGVIDSFEGGSSGPTVFAAQVFHPGTEPRLFQKTIARKWQPKFKRDMEGAMKRAAQKSGHGM